MELPLTLPLAEAMVGMHELQVMGMTLVVMQVVVI